MTTGLAFINQICDRLGWPQIETLENLPLSNEQRKILNLTNTVLQAMEGVRDWPMLRKDATLLLVGAVTSTDTQFVTATQNSDVLDVVTGTFDDSYKNRVIQVNGNAVVYRILDVLSPTQIQLDRIWVSDSIVVGDEIGFVVACDQYVLPTDFDRPAGEWKNFFGTNTILPIGPNEFEEKRRTTGGISLGDPRFFTIYGMNDAQTAHKIHFHEHPREARILPYSYIQIHPTINSDDDKILYPLRYHSALQDVILELALRDYEDSEKVQATLFDMLRKFDEQTPSLTDNRLRMRLAGRTRARMRAAARRSGIGVDYGDAFDIAGNIRL